MHLLFISKHSKFDLYRYFESELYSNQSDPGEELIPRSRGATATARMVTKEWNDKFPFQLSEIDEDTPSANVGTVRFPSRVIRTTPDNPIAKIRLSDKERLLRKYTIDELRRMIFYSNEDEGVLEFYLKNEDDTPSAIVEPKRFPSHIIRTDFKSNGTSK
eukprot:GHVP01021471.1.p1 GENE.GHVP01021471.1~~GHVP01021471.1.p1  ORF type:complete len:160 (+),score=24.11 GHVP01021471.1:273-752(+)